MNLISLMTTFAIGAILIIGSYDFLGFIQSHQAQLEDIIAHNNALLQAHIVLMQASSHARVSLCGTAFHWQHVHIYEQQYVQRTTLQPKQIVPPNSPLIRTWQLNQAGKNRIVRQSGVLVIRQINHTHWISQPLPIWSKVICLPRKIAIKKGQFITLQNCHDLLIDRVTSVQKFGGEDRETLQHALPTAYHHGAMVGQFHFLAYYISLSGLTVQNTQGHRYSLIPGMSIKEFKPWLHQ